jgi:hypothetical protein
MGMAAICTDMAEWSRSGWAGEVVMDDTTPAITEDVVTEELVAYTDMEVPDTLGTIAVFVACLAVARLTGKTKATSRRVRTAATKKLRWS